METQARSSELDSLSARARFGCEATRPQRRAAAGSRLAAGRRFHVVGSAPVRQLQLPVSLGADPNWPAALEQSRPKSRDHGVKKQTGSEAASFSFICIRDQLIG